MLSGLFFLGPKKFAPSSVVRKASFNADVQNYLQVSWCTRIIQRTCLNVHYLALASTKSAYALPTPLYHEK